MRTTLLTAGSRSADRGAVVDEGVVVEEYRTRSQARRDRFAQLRAASAARAAAPGEQEQRLAS